MPPVKLHPEASWPAWFYPILWIFISTPTPYWANVRCIFPNGAYRKWRRIKKAVRPAFNRLWTEWNKAPGPHHPRCDPALCSSRSAIRREGEACRNKKPRANFAWGFTAVEYILLSIDSHYRRQDGFLHPPIGPIFPFPNRIRRAESRVCGMRNTPQLAPLSSLVKDAESGLCCQSSWGSRSVMPRGCSFSQRFVQKRGCFGGGRIPKHRA